MDKGILCGMSVRLHRQVEAVEDEPFQIYVSSCVVSSDHVLQNSCHINQSSWNPSSSCPYRNAAKKGTMLILASSGNNGTDEVQWLSYPASYKEIISVAAVDCNNNRADFSQVSPASWVCGRS
jgi:serine protease